MAASLRYSVHQYGAHELQRVGVWDVDIAAEAKYWIVYIHGGAWRDPRVTHETFAPIITGVLEETGRADAAPPPPVAAFASLDYRLSPHPGFPQDAATTPAARLRAARHPDHLDDARAALAFLQRRFGFGARYVLAGHSAGACLAYQALLWPSAAAAAAAPLAPPRAVLGLEGIYDLRGADARAAGAYAEFLAAAFGPRGPAWDAASPALARGASPYGGVPGLALAALGHSPDDELVDAAETAAMAARLRADGVVEDATAAADRPRLLLVDGLRGSHDHVWQDGAAVARALLRILALLEARDRAAAAGTTGSP
ncbi:alpha/beta-hydrolase [Durotheca rogersii]|uniref:alpha/beta-hydrolase n=1 Tax=Durotheca rogersii TaxID=419775 RepID=UPI002220B725|nr:alpha/beta-hydrolase [Durotheca rogersii]KAI5862940.1 alpha/beta-hydrolase [Durotheca rogersii]